MSRLNRKIESLEAQIAELQGQLQNAEEKRERQTFKRRRKAYRKKLITDPMLRIAAKTERQMYETQVEDVTPGSVILGLLAQTQSFCSDCTCGKAEGCR